MADATPLTDQISTSQAQKEVTANAALNAAWPAMMFAKRDSTSSGLTWGHYGGRLNGASVGNGTVTLTASNTNYIVVKRSDLTVSVSTATTNWNNTTTYGRAYQVTVGTAAPTDWNDVRRSGDGHGILDADTAGLIHADGSVAFTADQSMGSHKITNLTDPASAQDAATKAYVDSAAAAGFTLTPNAQTGTTYTIVTGDRSKLVTFSNASAVAVTLPQAGASFPSGWSVFVENLGAGTVTITPTTSTIDGAASLTLTTNNGVIIASDGTNYVTMRGRKPPAGSDTQIQYNDGGVLAADSRLTFDKTNKVAKGQFSADSSAINAQTGTTYTLAATDNGKTVTLSNASSITLTVPSGLGAGFSCMLVQIGAGQVTITASSTTLNSRNGLKLAGQYAAASLIAYVADTFSVCGDTST